MKKKMVYTCYIRQSSLGYIYLPNVVALHVLTEDVMLCVPLCFILIHVIKTTQNNVMINLRTRLSLASGISQAKERGK